MGHDSSDIIGAPQSDALPPLHVLTCGSVDDGKSTLIGRLLFDAQLLLEDQLIRLERDSRTYDADGDSLDFAALLDGLEVEREQGITIDVAYRSFRTPHRAFVVADTPGHEQYTRNMATGASRSDVAIMLVDASKGLLPQTRRHTHICHLLGIRHFVLAVNKMDLISFSGVRFADIADMYRAFVDSIGSTIVTPIPLSARYGDNVIIRSRHTEWYSGPTLLEHLESINVEYSSSTRPFRFPVQLISRTSHRFRGLAGSIVSGFIRCGDPIVVSPSQKRSTVARIVTAGGDLGEARAGDAVTLTLNDDVDVGRGDVLAAPGNPPQVSDRFSAHVLWMADDPLLPGRSYLMRIGNIYVTSRVTALRYKLDIVSCGHLAARTLALNEIGWCDLTTNVPVSFDRYSDDRHMGAFIMIDRFSNATVGAGMIGGALAASSRVHWHDVTVNKDCRTRLNGHKPAVLWFTGQSGAGKSTIANIVEGELYQRGVHTYLLDGDNLRHWLNSDLGFDDADRVENVRRAGEVARLFVDAGLVVLCSFISPFRAERLAVREMLRAGEFVEIFVDTPLEECMRRDPKGLYGLAHEGRVIDFTGVTSPYEPPLEADLVLDAGREPAMATAQKVLDFLNDRGITCNAY